MTAPEIAALCRLAETARDAAAAWKAVVPTDHGELMLLRYKAHVAALARWQAAITPETFLVLAARLRLAEAPRP